MTTTIKTFPITNYTTSCDLKQQSSGVQLINFNMTDGMIEEYNGFMNGDGGLYVGALPLPTVPVTNHIIPDGVTYRRITVDENNITYTEA